MNSLLWLFETMMEAVDVDLADTEIRLRDSKTDEQVGEKVTLQKLVNDYKAFLEP